MSTFSKEKFSLRLKKQRINAGFERQADLAQAAGISAQAVSAYEAGDRLPSAETLAMMAEALGCTADYLVQLEDNAQRVNADISKQTGLSDVSIERLKEYWSLAQTDDKWAYRGNNAIDVVNCILEVEDFDTLLYFYQQLFFSFYADAGDHEDKTDEEKRSDFMYGCAKYGLVTVEAHEAIDMYIKRIGDFVSQAIREGVERKVSDMSR